MVAFFQYKLNTLQDGTDSQTENGCINWKG